MRFYHYIHDKFFFFHIILYVDIVYIMDDYVRLKPRADMSDDQLDDEVRLRTASQRGYRANYTLQSNRAIRLYRTAHGAPAGVVLLALMREQLAKCQNSLANVISNISATIYYSNQDQATVDRLLQLQESETERGEEAFHNLLTEFNRMESELAPPAPRAAAAAPAAPRPREARIARDLKPAILSREANPVEVKLWESRFIAYFGASSMDTLALAVQQEYFRACLDDGLIERLSDKITPAVQVLMDPVDPLIPSCVGFLRGEFLVTDISVSSSPHSGTLTPPLYPRDAPRRGQRVRAQVVPFQG